MPGRDMIERTSFGVRLCHWFIAACFFLVASSGLGWLFPSLSWLNVVFGTPQLARTLHPIFGTLIFLCLIYLFAHLYRSNLFRKDDLLWARSAAKVLSNEHPTGLRVGRYNLGQKILFWCILALICLLLISGLMIWRAYFADWFSIPAQRLALLAHSLAGIALILLIIGHIYLGIWVKGSVSGMLTGNVSRDWARTHHDGWYAEIVAKEDEALKSRGRT